MEKEASKQLQACKRKHLETENSVRKITDNGHIKKQELEKENSERDNTETIQISKRKCEKGQLRKGNGQHVQPSQQKGPRWSTRSTISPEGGGIRVFWYIPYCAGSPQKEILIKRHSEQLHV